MFTRRHERTTTCVTCWVKTGARLITPTIQRRSARRFFAIDYTGMVMRHAPYPEEQVLGVTIDIEALRTHRGRGATTTRG
jgi:hypothetical protein